MTLREPPGVVRVAVDGDVDAGTAPLLTEAFVQALAQRPERLEVDLSGVTYFSCAGLIALLRVAEGFGGDFAVVGTAGPVRKLLRLLGPDLADNPL